MTYDKFVQIGRIAYIAIGPDQGKLVAILDLIDTNRALVDGPNFQRKALNIKTLYLTKFRVKIPHSARESTVKKAWAKAEIDKKWTESNWAKKLAARKIRESLTDFDRFRLMRAKQTRNRLITLEAGKLRIKQKKANAETKKSAPAAKKPAAKAGKATGKK